MRLDIKKVILCLLCLTFMSGCNKSDEISSEQKKEYNEYRSVIQKNKGRTSSNLPLNYELSVQKIDNKYSYTFTINKPQIVMNDIKLMVVDSDDDKGKDMSPSVGIIDNQDVSLIPNQVAIKKGVPKGIVVNGISKSANFKIDALITFKDEEKMDSFRYFIHLDVVNGEVVK